MATKVTKTNTTTKATVAKAEASVKAPVAVKEEVKPAAATTTAKATTDEKKPVAKKATPAKKTTTAKKAVEKKNELFVQFSGLEFSYDELLEKVKADYIAQTGKKTINSTKLYLKPEDMRVYYVVNEKYLGSVYLG